MVFCLSLSAVGGPVRAAEPPAAGAAPTFAATELTIETAGGPRRLTVELADTEAQREYGLMFRREMAPDHGMLFDFRRDGYVAMWMKNTYIPLDMLFIDGAGWVVRIVRNARPMSLDVIDFAGPVRAVLELNGGAAARLGIRVGDRVRHAIFTARAR